MSDRKVVSKVQRIDRNKKPVQKEPVVKPEVKDFKNYLNVFNFITRLPGSGKAVKFKPMSIGTLKSFLTVSEDEYDPITMTEMLDQIFENCVINEDFDPNEMYVNDRYALLLEIRKKTKGETNQITITCPECKGQSVQTIDFEKIEVKEMPKNVNHIVKITDELSIEMDYETRQDELIAFDFFNELKKDLKKEQWDTELNLCVLAQTIKEIITPDGPQEDITINDKKYLIENIPQPLYQKITKWHEENAFGPDLTVEIKCPHCNFTKKEDITDLNFFS